MSSTSKADDEFDIAVVGASIIDFISYAPRLPRPGETLRGTRFIHGWGGKGANQCVAAARLGSKCMFVSKLGGDKFGHDYLAHLIKEQINTQHVKMAMDRITGVAQINVADNGHNQIVIIPGANGDFFPGDIEHAQPMLSKAKVLICQMEIPSSASLEAMRSFKGITILNLSPAATEQSLELFTLPQILCVNEIEAALISKQPVISITEAKIAVRNFMCLGSKTAIVTLGERGAVFASPEEPKPIHMRTQRVSHVVDTTGAGDAFLGALAHFIAKYPETSFIQKVGGACEVATMSVQHPGTQSSFPRANEIQFDIRNRQFNWDYA